MFVFWYCHKRGKEVRLAREAEGKQGEVEEAEVTDSADDSDVEEMVEELEKVDEQQKDDGQGADEKAAVLNQPAPAEVPLPETATEQGEKQGNQEEGTAAK